MGEPHYIVRIDAPERQVIIGEISELAKSSLTANRTNWLVDIPLNKPFKCQTQIRYNSAARSATAVINDDGVLHIEFDDPCDAIAPGQAVVCFDGDVVLGGGWII